MDDNSASSRDESCPLCKTLAEPLLDLAFAPKQHLPSNVRFGYCEQCDFIFALNLDAEAYRAFYRATLNDTGHVSDIDNPDNLFSLQAAAVCNYLGVDFRGSCLDFGSGEGQLLNRLADDLPNATFYGTDLRNSLRADGRIKFLENIDNLALRFDFIILSHVAEHFVDLSDLGRLLELLNPDGTLYIEVPDPTQYVRFPRREFMYYFDRLHVNHFSRRTLELWLACYGLEVTRFGRHAFAYRDGKYPGQFAFAKVGRNGVVKGASLGTLRHSFSEYDEFERHRAKSLRCDILKLSARRDLIVYGRGDNFFRSVASGGPLHELPIKAILDRNSQLSASISTPVVMAPAKGLAEYPNAVVLMTVSAGAEKIVEEINAVSPGRTVVMI